MMYGEEEIKDETLDKVKSFISSWPFLCKKNLGLKNLYKIAELLNEALISNKDTVRVTNLKHVQELILQKNPALLDSFLDVNQFWINEYKANEELLKFKNI